jgi:hypothetical protein
LIPSADEDSGFISLRYHIQNASEKHPFYVAVNQPAFPGRGVEKAPKAKPGTLPFPAPLLLEFSLHDFWTAV